VRRSSAREQHLAVERLGQIAIRPLAQARHDLPGAVERGEHEHRHVGRLAQPSAHVVPIEIGHHDAEDHQGGPVLV
jgi:hypothetical protein